MKDYGINPVRESVQYLTEFLLYFQVICNISRRDNKINILKQNMINSCQSFKVFLLYFDAKFLLLVSKIFDWGDDECTR